ncbi:MAG TPA: hypothetical protein VEK39_11720 [Solirubrobacterales bacterium]|nr:hypothetical protein [Solirubrobacterales bacterium]
MSRRFNVVAAICWAAALGALLTAGSALAAFPGTNGKIAYIHQPGSSNIDIFAMDPTGLNKMALTSTADDDFDPTWSADGEKVAFSRYAPGSAFGQIWVMNYDGTGQTQLTSPPAPNDDFNPAFSPDGTRIAFQRYDGSDSQIFIMNANGTGQTQLTFPGTGESSRSPSFSPNGQKIVFAHEPPPAGFDGISVMNPDGSGQTALTTGSATSQDLAPNFSPNGQKIVFDRYDGSQDDIFVMNADGSGQTPVTSGPEDDVSPVFSPEGTQVAFERENAANTFGNIFLADPGGLNQGLTALTSNSAAGAYDYAPNWQPLNPPDCDLTGKATSKSVKRVSVTVTCTNENAAAVLDGSGKAPKAPKGAVASKAKKFTIPPVTSQVAANAPTTITLKVSKKGQKALKKAAAAGKKGKATITATLTDDLGQSSNATFKVKFKAKK